MLDKLARFYKCNPWYNAERDVILVWAVQLVMAPSVQFYEIAKN